MTPESLDDLVRHLRSNVAFASHVGISIDEVGAGTARMSIEIGSQHLNGDGRVHGGVHAALADSAMGVALMSLGVMAATSQMNVHFLESVSEGRLVCVAEVAHRANRTATVSARIEDDAGRLIALASGSFRISATPSTRADVGTSHPTADLPG